MRSLILTIGMILAGAISASAQDQWLSLENPTSSAAVTISSTSFGVLRAEFRIEDISQETTTRHIWGLGAFPSYFCRIPGNSLILTCQFQGEGAPSGTADVDLTGRTDVRIRWQRDPSGLIYQIESWDGDCTNYVNLERPITSPLSPLDYGGTVLIGDNMRLGFLRLFSTLDSSGECPIDAPSSIEGDIFDFRFETLLSTGTLVDVSAHAYTVSAPGTSFVNSTPYDPQAVISGLSATLKPAFRTGFPISVNGSTSVVFSGDGTPSSYAWSQVSGPGTSVFSAPTSASTTITPPSPGQYVYRLTVNATGTEDLTAGVVTTDDNYVAVQSDEDYNWILGRVMLHGQSNWPWYEVTEAADVDILADVMNTPPTSVAGPGTIKATVPPNAILNGQLTAEGTGNAAVVWTGVGTNFTSADIGQRIVVNWDSDDDNTNQGRRVVFITAVNSPTEIVSSDYFMTEPPAEFSSGLTWGRLGVEFYPYNALDGNSFIAMFYEAGLAVGRVYAKTNLTTYQDQYHTFCDNWWRWGLGSGWVIPIPRNSGLHTMVACAADPSYSVPPDMWDGIARITKNMAQQLTTMAGGQVGYNPTSPVVLGTADIREHAYVLRPTALLARTYGAHGGSTSEWCGYLENQITNLWLETAAVPVGAPHSNYAFYEEDLFSLNTGYVAASHPAGDPAGHFGTSPWRSAGLPAISLMYAYEALADPDTCDNQTLANELFNPADGSGLIRDLANYIWDYARTDDGGVLYAEGYESLTQTGAEVGAGTITATNGSATITGAGTAFTTLFSPCDGTTYIGIVGTSARRVYQVMSCPTNTSLTINLVYAGTTEGGLSYSKGVRAQTDCGSRSISENCEEDPFGGRNLAADIAASAAWLFARTGDTAWRNKALYFVNKTFGGAAGGSGSLGDPTGSCVGDEASDCADGGVGNMGEILPVCLTNPAPCGEGVLNPKYGKPLGMASGAGNTPSVMADLEGAPIPAPKRRFRIRF